MSADRNDVKNDEKEFSFIQEQIVPKKIKKTKKIILIFLFTVFLAAIFGLVARYVFCVSESFFNNFLGLADKKGTITFPSEQPLEENKNSTGKDSDQENIDTGAKNPAGEDKGKTIVIENSVKADVSDYIAMYSKINEVAENVNKSIVTITSAEKAVDWFNNDYESKSITSGIILAKDESYIYILTNHNKLTSDSSIKVTFGENVNLDGEYQSSDSELNLAVVTVDLHKIPEIALDRIEVATLGESYLLSTGDPIMALGNPNGYPSSLDLGMITNKSNYIYSIDNKIEIFNTDINDNPNGEGVITNMEGEIVGIITQKFKTNLNKNINTVIAISRIKPIIEKLVNNKPMAYLGIIGADMSSEIAKGYGLTSGIYVTEVKAKSPAFHAGIKSGDVILKMEDDNTNSMLALNNLLLEYRPEQVVNFTIIRTTKEDSKETIITVTLGKKK